MSRTPRQWRSYQAIGCIAAVMIGLTVALLIGTAI